MGTVIQFQQCAQCGRGHPALIVTVLFGRICPPCKENLTQILGDLKHANSHSDV